MTVTPAAGFERTLGRLSGIIGLGVGAAGALVLAGWALDIPTLESLLPGLVTMKPNTALAFALSGCSLWLSRPRPAGSPVPALASRTARLLAALVAAIGLLTLGEYVLGWNLGIDQILFNESLALEGSNAPGRMAFMSAIDFVLLALALFLIDTETGSGERPSNWLALVIAANAFLAVLGYVYGVDTLYRVVALSAMALPTAIGFVVMSLGLACARPDSNFVRQIAGDNLAGMINRRLLPAAILIPPFVGWLRWQGELAGYYSTAFGLALFAASSVAIFATMVWWSARTLRQVHEHRIAVSETSDWQQAILNSADFTVISTGLDGTIRTINAGTAKNLGYAPEELIDKTSPAIIHEPQEIAARAQFLSQELGAAVEVGFETFVAKARLGGSDENDWTYIRKDGSRFPVRLSVTALRDAEGRLTGFLGIGKDITAQKIAEQALRDSEQQLRLLTDNLPALVAYIDRDQRYRFANSMSGRFLGIDTSNVIGQTMREVRGDAIYATIAEEVARVLNGELVTFEGKVPGKDRDSYYRSTYVPDRGPEGDTRGFYAMTFDISDLKHSELQIAASEARLRLISDNLPVLISYIDRERRFRFNNATYVRWLGRPLAEITGRRLDEVYDARTFAMIQPRVEEAFAGASVAFELVSPVTGRVFQVSYIPDFDARNHVAGVYGLINDITAQKEVEANLRQLTQVDALTGLANRHCLNLKLAEAIARSERSGEAMALIFLDLDRFKAINDTFGHEAGDTALKAFAQRLRESVRSTDTVARLAGDEFVIILEPIKHDGDEQTVAAKIVAAMAAPIEITSVQHTLSTSMGIAVRRAGETDGDMLMRRADKALYQIKAAGRGGFLVGE